MMKLIVAVSFESTSTTGNTVSAGNYIYKAATDEKQGPETGEGVLEG